MPNGITLFDATQPLRIHRHYHSPTIQFISNLNSEFEFDSPSDMHYAMHIPSPRLRIHVLVQVSPCRLGRPTRSSLQYPIPIIQYFIARETIIITITNSRHYSRSGCGRCFLAASTRIRDARARGVAGSMNPVQGARRGKSRIEEARRRRTGRWDGNRGCLHLHLHLQSVARWKVSRSGWRGTAGRAGNRIKTLIVVF